MTGNLSRARIDLGMRVGAQEDLRVEPTDIVSLGHTGRLTVGVGAVD